MNAAFRAGENVVNYVFSVCDEHLAVAFQGSGMVTAWNSEVLGGTPGSLIKDVDFHVRENESD